LTFAVSSEDFEWIRRTAMKKGIPYTVWVRDVVLRSVEYGPGRLTRPQGKIALSVPFEIRHYDRLCRAASEVNLPHGELSRRAILRALGKL
jgi:hypothetical protein